MRVYGATEAWTNVIRRNKFARWGLSDNPNRIGNSAAMRLRSPVFLPGMSPKFRIADSDVIFCIGSCFARNIERALIDFGIECASVPSSERDGVIAETFTKFSTVAMLAELRWALGPRTPFDEGLLLRHKDGTFSDLHSRHGVSRVSREAALAARHRVIEGMRRITRSDVVVLTLGLVEAWYDNELELYLNEAPSFSSAQRDSERFSLHVLGYNENLAALHSIHELLTEALPRRPKLALTVSPVPLTSTFSDRDVVVANMYSKATLRAVAQDFSERYDDVDYVPVFESVVSSAAEAAWEHDRIHVTELTVRANVLHFLRHYLANPAKRSQAADQLRNLLEGDRAEAPKRKKRKLPQFELAAKDKKAFPSGAPTITASSAMTTNYGSASLGSGPTVPWHAETPVGYPQTLWISFPAPLTPKALWLQAQDRHLDRAPSKFSVYGRNDGQARHLLLKSDRKPRWDVAGWASWRFAEAGAYQHFEIVIEANCGDPQFLTLQRLWFEPAAARPRRGALEKRPNTSPQAASRSVQPVQA